MTVRYRDIPEKIIEDDAEFLKLIADGLDKVDRIQLGGGYTIDSEGNRIKRVEGWSVIQLSDEAAKQLSAQLREIAENIKIRE